MKRTLSIILSLLMVLSLFTGLNISAAETDAADTGAEAELAETGDVNVDVTTAAQLKAALEANDSNGVTRYIRVQNDITYWTGVKGDNGVSSYVKTWCTLGKGKKVLFLLGHKLTFENDYAVTTAHPEMSYSELEKVNTLTLFSIPAGAELNVSVSLNDTSGAIWYNGKIIKNKDGIDNRDIFSVDGGKLLITGGSYSTDYRTQVYDYGGFSGLGAIHRLQVNGTPVTVNSGTAVINGGYFEGRGFSRYFYYESPSSKQPKRNGAIKFWGGRLIVNGGHFYGDNGAVPVQSYNKNYKLMVFNGGKFSVDTHNAHIGTEKGERCENTGCIGLRLYMPINEKNYNDYLDYYDDDRNHYSYDDAADNKLYYLDDSSEVNLYIRPLRAGSDYELLCNGEPYYYNYDNGNVHSLRWDNGEQLKLSVDPESMSFFGAKGAGQHMSAEVWVSKSYTSPGAYIIKKVPISVTLGTDGVWELDLAEFIEANLKDKLDYDLVNQRNSYTFAIQFTEGQDYTLNEGKDSYPDVLHLACFALHYQKPEYNLTFVPNGGMGEPFTVSAAKGEAYTLPNCPFGAPDGEEFDCWEIIDSEGGKYYRNPGGQVTVNENLTIRATWRSFYRTVTLKANNGTDAVKTYQVKKGTTFTFPPCTFFTAPENASFDRWQIIDQTGLMYHVGDTITITADTTFRATWVYEPENIESMIFNITAPEIGAHPDNTCTSMNSTYYQPRYGQWFYYTNENGGQLDGRMADSDVFEAGRKYAFGIDIKVLRGNKTSDTKIYIGDKEARYYGGARDYIAVFTMPAVVDKVEVSLTKPQAGEVPDYNAVVPENEYYERWEYDWTANGSQTYGGVSWYDYTDDKMLAPTDTFITGHQVKARVCLQTKEPHTFAPQEEMDFGEYSVGGVGFWREDKGSVDYSFTVEGEKYPLWLGSTQVCEENCDDILGDQKASYDPETHTLTLDYPTIEGTALYEDYFHVPILSEGIDLTVKGGYTMPSEKGGWFGIGAIGGTLTLDGDFTFYGSNAAVWGDNGVYITGGSLVAEGSWSGISAASSETTVSIGDKVDKVRAAYKQQGYSAISGKLELADNIVLTESDNGYQPGGAYYGYVIYEKKGNELKPGDLGNFSIDDPLAGMTLPTGDMLFDSDLYLGVTDEDYGYINGVRWHDADDNVLPADYTPQSGETVYLDIYLKPAGDNVFTEDTVLTVNGKEVACELIYGRYLMADNIAFTVGGEAAEYILGDTDGDGEVTSIDVTYIQRYCAAMKIDIDENLLMNADVDGNGELEIVDATFIQRWLAQMAVPYAVGAAVS